MLRIVQNQDATAAKRYFTEGLVREDYYLDASQSDDSQGVWGGKGAKLLGLSGEVKREAFSSLCENRHPDGLRQLTPRTKANRRVGYDINFHCPKSVSILHALTNDDAILEAFQRSVRETMQEIEGDMRTRVRGRGASGDRPTGNLLYGMFVHRTARPIGGIPDPHLHAHCFTFNATFDEQEGRWKACEFATIKQNAGLHEASFHGRLAGYLTALGYGLERRGKFWEVSNVPNSAIGKFSRRTQEIERVARARGITDPVAKDALGARTRRGKAESKPWTVVVADWNSRLSKDELSSVRTAKGNGHAKANRVSAKEAVDYALGVCLERQSVVREASVLEQAIRYGLGEINLVDARLALSRSDVLRREIGGERLVTTTAVLAEEQRVISFARDGRGSCRPLNGKAKEFDGKALTDEQRRVAKTILESPDRVNLIRGAAGTGKTTMMKATIAGIEAAGHPVTVLAPSASASRVTLRKAGFPKAETVSKFLVDADLYHKARNGVIWVDEAGQLGARGTAKLFDAAKTLNARIIFSGDRRQHGSVERGDMLRLLEEHAGLRSAEIQKIKRQSGEYKKAIEALSRGRTDEGFSRLNQMGSIREVKSDVGRYKAIANGYLDAMDRSKTALVISPTHVEGKRVTDTIRQFRRDRGHLGNERVFEQLRNLYFSEAERSNARSYQVGQVVQFHQNAIGFRAGERSNVIRIDNDNRQVMMSDAKGERPLPLSMPERFNVYERDSVHIAEGDKIRITRNGRTANRKSAITNGTIHDVRGFDRDGNITLRDGRTLGRDFCHLTHAYCLTSRAAQGASAQRVLIAQSTEQSGRAASKAQFYVSTSRGIESVTVFTDDKARLLESVKRDGEQTLATEFVKPGLAGIWLARAEESRIIQERREHGRER